MTVLTWENSIQQYIKDHYQTTELDNYRSVIVYRIDDIAQKKLP